MLKELYIKLSDSYYEKKYKKDKIKYQKEMMETLSVLPENEYEDFLKTLYKQRTSREMDFENPVTFTQKIQWLKLYDNPEEKSLFVDKYKVRQYIAETIGSEYLIPLVSIDGKDCFYNADDIDFSKLPQSFVLKCNHGSGYNIIVKNKSDLSKAKIKAIKKTLNEWLSEPFAYKNGIELAYKNVTPCILIEKYMAEDNTDFPDYKFLCFNGNVHYFWLDQQRFINHKRTVFNRDFSRAGFQVGPFLDGNYKIENKEEIEKLINLANIISSDLVHCRIDLYLKESKPYFGEITFYSGSGFTDIPNPDKYDEVLGNLIEINQTKRDNNTKYRKVVEKNEHI